MYKEFLCRSLNEYKNLGAEHTSKEITQQPALWLKNLNILREECDNIHAFLTSHIKEHTKIIFTGAGTSEFVGNSVVPYLTQQGLKNIYSISTTNLVSSPESYIHPDDHIVLVSFARSGNSPESIAAINIVNQICPSASHLVITCNPDGALAQITKDNTHSSFLFSIQGAHDVGFAMTGSFTCMTLISALIFQMHMLEKIIDEMKSWISEVEDSVKNTSHIIANIVALKKDRFICLGAAGFNGIAQESHLKILELSASLNTACFDTPLGFRHGPKSVLNDKSLVLMFMSADEYTRKYEYDMLKELMSTSGTHYVVAITPIPIPNAQDFCHTEITIPLASEEFLHMIHAVVIAQAFALENSISLGIASDNPSPSGSVNRVVQGVTIYPYKKNRG